MKFYAIFIACLALCGSIFFSTSVVAQLGGIPEETPNLPGVQPANVVVTAPCVSVRGTTVSASGGVSMQNGKRRITASEACYDANTASGELKNATFTTCNASRPEFLFTARKLTFLPNNRLRAQHVSLFLGHFKVITLPSFSIAIGGRGVARDVFPRPTIDKNDGVGISQVFRLALEDRLKAVANVRVTTKRGFEGDIANEFGLDGQLYGFPGRYLTYESLRNSALTMPRLPIGGVYLEPSPCPVGIARLRQFGIVSLKQRTYDVRNTGLLVYRQPEIGLNYTSPALNFTRQRLDPRLELYPTISGSWGRFKEVPGSVGFTTRRSISVAAPVNILPLGRDTAIQPVLLYSAASYGDGDFYSTSGYAIDASHALSNGSIAMVRYIQLNDSGQSPFIFDTVSIHKEFQAAIQLALGRNIIGFVTGYNADVGNIYDWEALYGYRTDCLAGWITWHQRIQRLMFDVALLNF